MTALIAGLFIGAAIGVLGATILVAGGKADEHAEIMRLRAALGYLMRASPEPAARRYIARVLDPDGRDAGA